VLSGPIRLQEQASQRRVGSRAAKDADDKYVKINRHCSKIALCNSTILDIRGFVRSICYFDHMKQNIESSAAMAQTIVLYVVLMCYLIRQRSQRTSQELNTSIEDILQHTDDNTLKSSTQCR
jgi:hypothetical protein